MKATLIIQRFGPINDLQITINKFNILIGPQAAGKSTISKVLCVIQSFEPNLSRSSEDANKFDELKQLLAYYHIENFYKKNTYWFFEDDNLTFELKENKVSFEYKKVPKSQFECYYFPAERIAFPMISESIFELNLSDSTLPKYFLQFGNDFIKARRQQKTFNLPLLDVEYEYKDGKNIVTLRNNQSLLLEETSSAIQANLPMQIILQYPARVALLFVIEELELHCFPQLQKQVLYYIVERMKHPGWEEAYVVMPTHSPYLLSAMNNLLFAGKVSRQSEQAAIAVNGIISSRSWISIEDFSAYYVKDGGATSIVDPNTGLIYENELDKVSEDLAGEFDALMELYKPAMV